MWKEKTQMQILKDLQGNPYKFYRGKNCDYISNGCFFCSCFDIAESYRLYDETPIIETEIQVRNPLVIDATVEDGHSIYEYLHVYDCKLYPEEKRSSLNLSEPIHLNVWIYHHTFQKMSRMAWLMLLKEQDIL